MTERLSCVALYHTRLWRMTELCTRFNIGRQTGDTWLRRDAHEGYSGLQDDRRAPLSCPLRIAPAVAAVRLEATQLHPPWGARTILPPLARLHPALEGPAASRTGTLFRQAGRSRSKQWRIPVNPAEPASPGHGVGRRVRNAGTCRLTRRPLVLLAPWLQEGIALEATGGDLWSIACDDVLLARLDERDCQLRG